MSVSHSWFGAAAVNSRSTRSSWTGGPGLRSGAALPGVHREQIRCWVHSRLTRFRQALHAPVGELVGDEPVAELGVVVVDVDRGVDQVRVVPVPLGDRVGAPLVEGLLGEAEHPAGHRDGDARRRRGHGPAGTSFWEGVAGEVGRRAAQDLVLLLELLGPLAQLAVLGLQVTVAAPAGAGAGPTPSSRSAIRSQRARQDSETPKLRATCAIDWSPWRATAITSPRNSLGTAWADRVPGRGVARRVLLRVDRDYAVCSAGWSITSLGLSRRGSRAVGAGGLSSAMDSSDR